jgi:hypothetical protein
VRFQTINQEAGPTKLSTAVIHPAESKLARFSPPQAYARVSHLGALEDANLVELLLGLLSQGIFLTLRGNIGLERNWVAVKKHASLLRFCIVSVL